MAAQVIEQNDAEKGEAASTLQKYLHHQLTDAFCKQAAKNVGLENVE